MDYLLGRIANPKLEQRDRMYRCLGLKALTAFPILLTALLLGGCASDDFGLGRYQMSIDPSPDWKIEIIGGYGPGGPDVHAVALGDRLLLRPELRLDSRGEYPYAFYMDLGLHDLSDKSYQIDLPGSYLTTQDGRKLSPRVFLGGSLHVTHFPGPQRADFLENQSLIGKQEFKPHQLITYMVFFDIPMPKPGESFDVQLGDIRDGDEVIHVPLMHFRMDDVSAH